MEQLYIALVDTPGLFASIIRRVIRRDYVHVVLSLDEQFKEAYSVGRRNPFIPFFAGFEKENVAMIVRKFPGARYRIMKISCGKEQKREIAGALQRYYQNRFNYHYCILGLPFLLLNRPFYQKGHYTCSSFTARLLEENGLTLFDKHFSLVTPGDFYDLKEPEIIYEGLLKDYGYEDGKQYAPVYKTA